MKEQKFDLIESLQKAAETGLTIVQDAIFQTTGENVYISETFIRLAELESLENLLEEVKVAETIDEMGLVLNEDSLPVELVIFDQFWGEFQELIYKLPNKEIER